MGLLVWACGAGEPQAAGYGLFEQGSRALGTAGAFTATADDPSAIFYNAAGIARLQGTQLYAGVSPIVPKTEFAGTAPYPGYGVIEKWRDNVIIPPHAYATFHLGDYVVGGIGLHVPFGLKSDWWRPETFTGRYISTLAEVRGVYLNPTVAVELTPAVAIGGGIDVVFADATLERRVPYATFDGSTPHVIDVAEATLEGDVTIGLTFNVGALIERGRLRVGLAYRHGVRNEIEGDARFEFLPTGDAAMDSVLEASLPADQRATAEIPFPAMASLGAAYRLGERWRAEANLNWTGWSIFDELPLTFEDDALSMVIEEKYDDVFSVRTGVTFQASERMQFRGGYYFDPSPAPSASVGPILPDSERNGVSVGIGYASEGWRLDLFEMLLFFREREVRNNRDNFNGNYDESAWISGVSLGYSVW
jgi:long-chain fatty acid transport protein